jgi:hypothetical protein
MKLLLIQQRKMKNMGIFKDDRSVLCFVAHNGLTGTMVAEPIVVRLKALLDTHKNLLLSDLISLLGKILGEMLFFLRFFPRAYYTSYLYCTHLLLDGKNTLK